MNPIGVLVASLMRDRKFRLDMGCKCLGVGQRLAWTVEATAIMSDLSGTRMDTTRDNVHSVDSQETTFSSTSDKPNVVSGQDTSDADTEADTQAATNERRRYPYWQLFFIMAATTGER